MKEQEFVGVPPWADKRGSIDPDLIVVGWRWCFVKPAIIPDTIQGTVRVEEQMFKVVPASWTDLSSCCKPIAGRRRRSPVEFTILRNCIEIEPWEGGLGTERMNITD